jgi:FkbM family methyltransferase
VASPLVQTKAESAIQRRSDYWNMKQVEGRSPSGERFAFVVHSIADQHVSPAISSTGEWEPFTTRVMASLLQAGDSVLDIGANIGWYSVVLGKIVGPSGRVLAFEPDPTNAEVARQNIGLHSLDHVTLYQCALADEPGLMNLARSSVNLGDHRLAPTGSNDSRSQSEVTDRAIVEVQVQRLDDVIPAANELGQFDPTRLRVVKIDTQGAEVMILRGAPNLWSSLPAECAAIIEFAPNMLAQHSGDQVSEFIGLLSETGRQLFTVRQKIIVPTTAAKLRRLADKLRGVGDEWAVDVLVAPRDPLRLKSLKQFQRFGRLRTFRRAALKP